METLYYVDKTDLIRELLAGRGGSFMRSCRFGKSLNMSSSNAFLNMAVMVGFLRAEDRG